MTIRCII